MLALTALLGLAACGDDTPAVAPAAVAAATAGSAADPARGMTTALDGSGLAFGDGIVAELGGDDAAARVAFERVLGGDAPAPIAARAALHLAQLEERAGNRRRALDLGARAVALAPADLGVTEGVKELKTDIVAASGTGDARGPRIGTALAAVEPAVADAFAAAERALAALARFRLQEFEVVLGEKDEVTEDVAAKYRAIAERADGVARIAASYRIGSLYHALALALLVDLLPQLSPRIASSLGPTLRSRATKYLWQAVAAYRAAVAVAIPADAVKQVEAAELWRLAAETDLRGALELLRAAGER